MRNNHVDLLLVEDDPRDLELTLRVLQKHNLTRRTHVVRDGAAALDFLLGGDPLTERLGPGLPRVVLLDLKLPKVDGLEVLERIRADARTRSLPVVVLTSSEDARDVAECYRRGGNSYIVKPVDSSQFARAVEQLGLYWLTLNEAPRT